MGGHQKFLGRVGGGSLKMPTFLEARYEDKLEFLVGRGAAKQELPTRNCQSGLG